ncbi:MAG: TMEM165/GDT1 family protein [Euryarchaeota archaeon]|nr:TMEM165/GDT1 family protein [Euryarchaeota archaeon]
MDLAPLVSAFVLIALMEIGDKTMIAVITLSSKHSRISVFIGAILALGAVSAIGVLVGEVLFELVPRNIVEIAAGLLFIAAGLYTLIVPEKEEKLESRSIAGRWGGAVASFSLVALMELGDKTQLSIIALSAESGSGLLVFIGAMIAFAMITLAEVFLGGEIGKRVDKRYIRWGSGAVFLIFGIFFFVQALI